VRYRQGDRVRHPDKEEWGLGEVLENSRGEVVRVLFTDVGEKTMSLRYAPLEKIPPEAPADSALERLRSGEGCQRSLRLNRTKRKLPWRRSITGFRASSQEL
jgi:hypothetical protein